MPPTSSRKQRTTSATPSSSTKPERKPRNKACTACQQRKVSCKIDEPGRSCYGCAVHGLPCSRASTALGLSENDSPSSASTPAPEMKSGFRAREGRQIVNLRSKNDLMVNLAPSSSTSRLALTELGGALAWSLVKNAFASTTVTSTNSLSKLDIVKRDFRDGGMRSGALKRSQEIMLACYVALGSRRTEHSAIVGGERVTISSESLLETLGTRREGACRALATHASMLLTSSPDILTTATMDNLELVSLVQTTLQMVDVTNPVAHSLVPVLSSHCKALADSGYLFTYEDAVNTGFELYDARMCARKGIKCSISTEQIEKYHFFTAYEQANAFLNLGQPYKPPPSGYHVSGWCLTIQFSILRRLYDVEVASKVDFTGEATATAFETLYTLLDLAMTYISTQRTRFDDALPAFCPSPSPIPPSPSPSPQLSTTCPTLPFRVQSSAATEAALKAFASTPRSSSPFIHTAKANSLPPATRADFDGQVPDLVLAESFLLTLALRIGKEGIVGGARRRWSRAIRWLADVLDHPSYRATKADEHWLARRLESVFEPVPNWVSLVVELAFLDELEAGDDGLRWEDLRKLLRAFEAGSNVMDVVARRSKELKELLRREGRETGPGSDEDLAAKELVREALASMELEG